MTAWPPTVTAVQLDAKLEGVELDSGDLARLQLVLDAAVALVERLRAGSFDFRDDAFDPLPAPGADVVLGTVRLAGRWHARRRSPDGLISAGELGTSRIPNFDADIERLLGIGRYSGPVLA